MHRIVRIEKQLIIFASLM